MHHPATAKERVFELIWNYGLWVAFALVAFYQVFISFQKVSPFEGGMLDGPFQLYNWLRRIDVGQAPGGDFPCFHGVGVPYLHYPLYRLFGGDLFAMELSRQLVSRLGTLLAYLVISKLSTEKYTLGIFWSFTTLPSVTALVETFGGIAMFLGGNALLAHDPSVSMYGLRGLLPLVLIATYFREFHWQIAVTRMLLLAASFLCGIEYGMALLLSFVVSIAIFACAGFFQRAALVYAKQLALVFGGAVLLIFGFLLLTCGYQGLLNFGEFHFQYQIQDQAWYFGSPPNSYLLDGQYFSKWVTICLGSSFIAVAGYDLWLLRKLSQPQHEEESAASVRRLIAVNFAVISTLSLLGTLSWSGTTGLTRVMWMFSSIAAYQYLASVTYRKQLIILRSCALLVVISGLAWNLPDYYDFTGYKLHPAHQEHLKIGAPLFQDAPNIAQPKLLWSVYSGLYEAELGIYPPSKWDYMIHALGADRQRYAEQFEKTAVKYVVTTRNDTNGYEEWLRKTSFPFYLSLLKHYRIIAETPFMLLWQRAEPGTELLTTAETFVLQPAENLTYTVPAAGAGEKNVMYLIEIDYETYNDLRGLPLLGNCPRYLVHVDGAANGYDATLPPGETKHLIPVIPLPGQGFTLQFRMRGLRWNATIDVQKLRVTKVLLDDANQLFLKSRFSKIDP